MKLIALDTTATITKGFPYFSTKELDRFYKIMDDKGTIRLMLKSHFVRADEQEATATADRIKDSLNEMNGILRRSK